MSLMDRRIWNKVLNSFMRQLRTLKKINELRYCFSLAPLIQNIYRILGNLGFFSLKSILCPQYLYRYQVYAAVAKSLQSCPTLCDPIDGSPPGSPIWDSPGKNTGVGYHFLLQHMEVKNESAVAQSCPTLRDPMDCSLPGSSVHGILQARVLEWGATAFSNQVYNID